MVYIVRVLIHQTSTTIVMTLFFFFNDTATTEIYTLSLHDALPIWGKRLADFRRAYKYLQARRQHLRYADYRRLGIPLDRKSTRLNSSHANISYAVFCLKKKKKKNIHLKDTNV